MRAEAHPEDGFSLLEVIISLAFFSLISVLLFQSLLTQYRALDRIDAAIESGLDNAVERRLVKTVLSKTLAEWPDQPETQFSGNPKRVKGLTTANLTSAAPEVTPYDIEIIDSSTGSEVIVRLGDEVLPTVTIPGPIGFEYFGYDGRWRSEWPPALDDPYFGTSVDAILRMSALPDHIRLVDLDGDQSVILIAPIVQKQSLPLRLSDVLSTQ